MSSNFPFRNLVFQGGGIKALAYHGVLPILEEYEILPQIQRVAGSSAGALLASILSFRLSAKETIDLFKAVDYSKIIKVREGLELSDLLSLSLDRGFEKFKGRIEVALRFLKRYGLYANDYAYEWLLNTIANHCDGNGKATFANFQESGFRDLFIVVTNISKHCAQVFSAETTPDVAVADAILISGSLPFFFEAPQFDGTRLGNGDYYADGGVLSNFPLHIFDHPRFEKVSRNYDHGVNWETLGCRLFTPDDLAPSEEPIKNIIDYVENLFETIGETQAAAFENSFVDHFRTISISNCGVAPTNFKIRPDENDQKYLELVSAGEIATRHYLEKYKRSTDKLYVIKERLAGLLNLRD